jgi:hypothetical protein
MMMKTMNTMMMNTTTHKHTPLLLSQHNKYEHDCHDHNNKAQHNTTNKSSNKRITTNMAMMKTTNMTMIYLCATNGKHKLK